MKRLTLLLVVGFLAGCGQVPVAPSSAQSVQITWQPGSDGVSTFNLYRNNVKLFGPVSVTSFDDTAVQPGSTYCYYVTAFSSGIESKPSNTMCVEP